MIFSSAIFLLMFLPIVFLGNLLMRHNLSNYFLLLASILFYAWGEPYLVLLMITSILINWSVGLALSKTTGKVRIIFLVLGLVSNLAILGYYKYAGFIAETVNYIFKKELIPVLDIALPIGISFYTFQAISYIVDVYKRDAEVSNSLVNVALYISFFPQLIAGPIVKYKDINKQLEKRSIIWTDVSDGFKRFIYGLGKKVLIANTLGICVDTIYSYDITSIDCRTAWVGALAYTFQIYYDFSGYSDMAIGLGRMFGFRIMENFEYPYLSRSISEFWRKWHISLGIWFREYVYIPLGGNRINNIRTYINLLIVFFLTGLWHGADVSFVIWGLFHGLLCIIEKAGLKNVLNKANKISVIYTFFVVTIGWVFFRSKNALMGIEYVSRMILPWQYEGLNIAIWNYMDKKTIFIFACAFLGMGCIYTFTPKRLKEWWDGSAFEAFYCTLLLLLCLSSIVSDTYNPFIYFQF